MKRPVDDVLAQGLAGGVLAGAVVAAWFLIVDLIQGQPFHTPAVLAYFFFHREALTVTAPLVVFFTVLHLSVFAMLGVAAAWALEWFDTAPGLLLGAVFGVIVLDLVFYGSLLISGADLFGVLPGVHVFGANLVGGMVLMGYLHGASHERRPMGLAVLRGHPLLTDGIVTGLIGAAAVALWFLALDLAAGHPFHTPAALGAVVFLGAEAGDVAASGSVLLIAAYTVLHVAVFAAIGVLFVAFARQLERAPQFVLLIGLACILLEGLVLPGMALAAEWVLGSLGWWSVSVGNALAVAVMAWWIWRQHPALRSALHAPVEVRT